MEADPTQGKHRAGDFVQLTNPVRHNFESFIFANALVCERVVEERSAVGQTVVICGAGPSLAETVDKWVQMGDQVWGCNSAAIWLYEHGYPVTHAFTIDQTPHMIDELYTAPPVEYLLATSVHPGLPKWLLAHDRTIRFFHNYVGLHKPPVQFCECGHDGIQHDEAETPTVETGTVTQTDVNGEVSPVGAVALEVRVKCTACDCAAYAPRLMQYEDWLYASLYPATLRAGSGLNATTRAIDVALFMGFTEIILLGADCAIRFTTPRPPEARAGSEAHRKWLDEATVMHADGGSALASGATATVFEGEIDGRTWLTKPDLVITAVWLERWRRRLERARLATGTGARLRIMGDTLPRALRNKDDHFLNRMPSLVDEGGNVLQLR